MEILFDNVLVALNKRILLFKETLNPLFEISESAFLVDFVCEFLKHTGVSPCDIQVECAIPKECFQEKTATNSKRPNRPKIDFYCANKRVAIEFSVFKGDSNKKAEKRTNSTEKIYKALNDALRLYSFSKEVKIKEAYLALLVNGSIWGAKPRKVDIDAFPAENFEFSKVKMQGLKKPEEGSRMLDVKFFKKLKKSDSIKINLEYCKQIPGQEDIRLVVYKVMPFKK